MPQLVSGQTIAGYRIDGFVGRGGMGEVYRATQVALERPVALKLVLPELSRDEGFRERFRREAKLAASLEHPNVLPVYEAGDADGQLFLSMRLVDGETLHERIARGRLEPEAAAGIVAQLADALDAAHARGLVHRDIKPANVLLERRGGAEHAYLTDFGLSKLTTASQPGPTQTGQLVGTLDYVPPEQISSGQVDARGDVYSLGCLFYECLTGEPPFPRDTDVAKLWAHVNDEPPAPSSTRPGLSAAFDDVIRRSLAKYPGQRYPSAGDLGRAAVAAAQGRLVFEPERSVATGEAVSGVRLLRRAARRRTRRAWMLAALGILVATGATVAALAAAGVFSREGASQAPPRPPAAEPAPAGPPQAAPAEVVAPPPGAEPAAVPAAVSSEPIQLTGTPIDIAVGDGRVWTITEEGDLYEIDAARNQVVGAPTRLSIREGTLRALEYDAARDALWLGQTDRSQRGFLVRLDPATRQPVGATLRVGDFPVDLALGGGYVWVLTGGDPSKPSTTSALVKIDGASGEIVAGPAEIGPAGAANLAVADDAVWITEYELHQVLRVDPSTLEVVGEPIEIDGFPLRIELAAGRPWFTYEGVESLGRIDPSANEVVGTRLQVDGAPFFMDADERGIWVATGITNTLHWIDPELEQVVATVPASADPGPVAAGAGKVWVGSFKDDTITSFDPRAIERSPAEPGTPDEPGQPPESGSLPPGTYSASGFEPRFSFSVQEGWWKNLSLPQVFSIVQDRVTNPGLDFGRPDAVFTGTALDTEPFPDDVIAWLRSRPGVEVSEATTVTVGGHGGRQVDVQLVEPPEEYPRDCVTPCLPLFAYGERGLMQLELGPPTRIIELDVDGITVIVTIGMSRGTEVELEEFRRRAEAVLRTVVFG